MAPENVNLKEQKGKAGVGGARGYGLRELPAATTSLQGGYDWSSIRGNAWWAVQCSGKDS